MNQGRSFTFYFWYIRFYILAHKGISLLLSSVEWLDKSSALSVFITCFWHFNAVTLGGAFCLCVCVRVCVCDLGCFLSLISSSLSSTIDFFSIGCSRWQAGEEKMLLRCSHCDGSQFCLSHFLGQGHIFLTEARQTCLFVADRGQYGAGGQKRENTV